MGSIVRREDSEEYEELLRRLALASGITTPTWEDLAKLDRLPCIFRLICSRSAIKRQGGKEQASRLWCDPRDFRNRVINRTRWAEGLIAATAQVLPSEPSRSAH
jgi:hypothetical protein